MVRFLDGFYLAWLPGLQLAQLLMWRQRLEAQMAATQSEEAGMPVVLQQTEPRQR